MVNNFTGELELHPVVLVKWGEEDVKFSLGKVDDMSSSFFSKLFEVKLGSSAKGFKGGLGGRQGWGSDDIGVWVDRTGLKGIWVNEGDARVSKQGGIGGGLGGSKKRKIRDNEFGAGSNSG